VGGAASWVWRHRGRWSAALPPTRLLAADLAGGLVLAVVALLLAQPYLRVLELYPYARRTVAWVALYSPPPSGLFTAPEESAVWGDLHAGWRASLSIPGEMALLPGIVLIALAVAGLFVSVWSARVRAGLGVGALVFAVLSLGTNGPFSGRLGYVALL